MDPALVEARNLDGSARFFPPGQHPATARLRAQLAALERMPESPERDEIIAYVADQVAAFEDGESLAKAVYLQRFRGFV